SCRLYQPVLGGIDQRRQVVVAPPVRVQFLDKPLVSLDDFFACGACLDAQNLQGLLLSHFLTGDRSVAAGTLSAAIASKAPTQQIGAQDQGRLPVAGLEMIELLTQLAFVQTAQSLPCKRAGE